MEPRQGVVELVGFHRAGQCLAIALSLLLGACGTLAFAADQQVLNTGDSGADTLRQAVADVGAGENVSFQPAVAGGTITLLSDLDVSRSMNFVNDSGGAVTVNTGAHTMNVADASTISLDAGLTFQTTSQPAICCDGSFGIAGLHGDVTAETGSGENAWGLYALNDLSITGGLSGTVSANAATESAYAMFAHSGDLSIAGGLSGNVSATANGIWGAAYAITATGGGLNGGDPDTPLLITGNVSTNATYTSRAIWGGQVNLKLEETGTISAISTGGAAHAVLSEGSGNDTVELVAGCTIVGDIDLADGAGDTLTLSGAAGSTTYAGDIEGVENLNATGGTWTLNGVVSDAAALDVSGGTLTLGGLNIYTGGTTVSGGTLIVNGRIVGDTDITSGTLCGVGQIGNLINSGTLAPGNSIGTLTVAGDYTQNAGSTLENEINDSGGTDLVDVSGTATLNGGTVDVQAESGTYTAGMTYTFLDADGGVTGTFDAITDDLPLLTAVLVYGPNGVQILLQPNHTPYIDVAQTYNQRAVAGYLDDHYAGATGDFLTILTELDTLSDDSARAALDAMSGELYPSLSTLGIENTDRFLRLLAARLRARGLGLAMAGGYGALAAETHWNDSEIIVRGQDSCGCAGRRHNCRKPWAEGFGVGASIAGNGNASGLGYSVGGLTFGIEDYLTENTLFGVVGGYANTYVALDERIDRATIDAGQVGAYLHRTNGLGYATGIAAFDYSSYDTQRQVIIGDIVRTANAGYGGNDFSFYLEAGRYYQVRTVHLQPYAALQYIQLHQNDFIEGGAQSVDLSVGGIHADSFRGLLGTRLVSFLRTKGGRLLSLEGRALWRHEFLGEARVLDATFAGQPGGAFVINGVNVDRDAAILGCGTAFYLAKGAKLFADYDLLVSGNYTAHAGSGGVMLVW